MSLDINQGRQPASFAMKIFLNTVDISALRSICRLVYGLRKTCRLTRSKDYRETVIF